MPCDDTKACLTADHCKSGVCEGDVCQVPTCNDTVKNGIETDVDCGGSCFGCGPGQGCAVDGDRSGDDCSGTACNPSCAHTVKNRDETDIDCGGTDCGGCPSGKACVHDSDCLGVQCTGSLCE